MDNRRRRQFGIFGGLLLLGAGSYALYKYYYNDDAQKKKVYSQGTEEGNSSGGSYTRKRVAIVLTDSIVASKLPINEILSQTSDVVLVLPPELTVDDLNEKLDASVSHKAIECDTFGGVWSVIKHLGSELIFVVSDDLEDEIPKGLERYVGEIIELDQNLSVINECILSSIIT